MKNENEREVFKDILVRRHGVGVEFQGRERIPTKTVVVEKCDHEVCQLLLFLH
jgi:hypothetical protein